MKKNKSNQEQRQEFLDKYDILMSRQQNLLNDPQKRDAIQIAKLKEMQNDNKLLPEDGTGFQPINQNNLRKCDGGSDDKKKRDFSRQYPVKMDEVFCQPTKDRQNEINYNIFHEAAEMEVSAEDVLILLFHRGEITMEELIWFKSNEQ